MSTTDDIEEEIEEEIQRQEKLDKAEIPQINHSKQVLISFFSGVGAGLLCTIVCAPFDVAKIRLQVQGSLKLQKYTGGTFRIIQTIYREEGFRGVFRGVGPAMISIPLFWGVYWPVYDYMKGYFQRTYPPGAFSLIQTHMICAIMAGATSDVITNPFWVTRTRVVTIALHKEIDNPRRSISTFEMMRKIYRQEGILAFYRGLGASFLGLGHVAIQFPLCEYFSILF